MGGLEILDKYHIDKKVSRPKKKNCVLYGNCQVEVISEYLKKKFSNELEINYIANYKKIWANEKLPIEIIKNADIFIYHPINGHGEYDTDYLKSQLVKKKCKCISFAYLYFLGYFPDLVLMPSSKSFTYGSKTLNQFIINRDSLDKIINKLVDINLFSKQFVFEKYNHTIGELRKREQKTDIKLADFIERNFRKHRLFLSVNHPSNLLFIELLKGILAKIGLKVKNLEADPFFESEVMSCWPTGIIYPSVAAAFNLEFDISYAYFSKEKVSFNEYIAHYIEEYKESNDH